MKLATRLIPRHYSLFVSLMIAFTLTLSSSSVFARTNCLFAVTEGTAKTTVIVCPKTDPLNLVKDQDIGKIAKAFQLDLAEIRFVGCPGATYMVDEVPAESTSKLRFQITYRSDDTRGLIAAVTHELAHVLQVKQAGGWEKLRKARASREIELGADFLTGIVFGQSYPGSKREDFLHGLALTGQFREDSAVAHGTQAMRTNAFRRGWFLPFSTEASSNYIRASARFFEDYFGQLIHHEPAN